MAHVQPRGRFHVCRGFCGPSFRAAYTVCALALGSLPWLKGVLLCSGCRFVWKRVSVAFASQVVDRMREFRCCLADSDCPGVSLEETEAADCTDGWEREWTVVRLACVVTHWYDC